jgi:zinc protease
MIDRKSLFALSLSTLALAACAPGARQPGSTPLAPKERPQVDWAFMASDIPVDPAYRFGKLENGLRYAIRRNATPKGTALIRMSIAAGSLDESDDERGFAHFVEHMAFNGSTNVPEGEMIKLLERNGLAFGADTNASTSFDRTTYMLDLPRNDPALLGTALMLMRETASELKFDPAAVTRERGVVLAEMRDRNSPALRNFVDQAEFFFPGSRFSKRLPIGTAETLDRATAQGLKAFWQREYVPAQTILVVIGDFPEDVVETAIRERFSSWGAAPAEKQPNAGPVVPGYADKADIYLEQGLSERVVASRQGPWSWEADTRAQRQENLLRQLGYAIVNRRLQRLTRDASPPFRAASLGTGDLYDAARTTSLSVDTIDGKWKRGLAAAALEYRRALQFGFTPAEVAEQIANVRTATRNAAASADTRSHGALVGAVLALISDDQVPDTPQRWLDSLEAFIPQITADTVLAALKRDLIPLDRPLLRFQGRTAPAGAEKALLAAWREAAAVRLKASDGKLASTFGYTEFGTPGALIADTREPVLGIRTLRFANGVRLNLKRTEIEKDRLLVRLDLDGGNMLQTREAPLATAMTSVLAAGGLGKHSADDLQSLLAGHTVSASFSSNEEVFSAIAATTPQDLALQLQLWTAFLTDPGFRPEGETQFRQAINNYFLSLRATPGSVMGAEQGRILSDNDPRFSLQTVEAYRKLDFAQLKAGIGDRLARGAIEIGLVGDFDEDRAIAAVAATLGALPERESEFRPYTEQRQRPFTADRSARMLYHAGPRDQAMLKLIWPTRDGEDPEQLLRLSLLERVVQIELTEVLREKLGKAYSPDASSDPSRVWRGYGTFSLTASVAPEELATVRAALAETVKRLRDQLVSEDELLRARAPLMESFENLLKSNSGWLAYVDRAQSEADRIDRYAKARQRLAAITAAELQELARRYLTDGGGVEIAVLPDTGATTN